MFVKTVYGITLKAVVVTLVSFGFVASAGAVAASAATLYDNVSYGGASFTATSAAHVGGMNDRASSLRASKCVTFYENQDYKGRYLRVCSNYASLVGVRTGGMGAFEDWNDRITSFR